MIPKKCPACKQNTLSHDEDFIFCTNCPIYKKRLSLLQKPLVWASNKLWWWRAPIFAWFVVMLIQNLHKPDFAISRMSNPFSAFDLGIHELGHILFTPFGEFMYIIGGSLFQCLFPLLWMAGCIQKRWYFAASLCLCWLGLNLFDVAAYAADARARILPLSVGFGALGIGPEDTEKAYDRAHDWYQILSRTDHLNSDLAIAHGLRIAATFVFITGLILAAILLIQMILGTFQRLTIKPQANRTITK